MIVFRAALGLYLLVLSFLLLAPDPLTLLGFPGSPGASSLRLVHFALFAVLGFLAWASRWPLRSGTVLGLLVGYALVTESLQWFIPTRTVELLDYLENLLGLVAGVGAWHILQRRGPAGAHGTTVKPKGNDVEAPAKEENRPAQD